MLAFLQYLIALVIASHSLADRGRPFEAPDLAAIGLTLLAFGLAWHTVCLVARARTDPASPRAIERHLLLVDAGRVAALAVFWVVAQPLAGRELPRALGVGDWVFVPHLVRLLPFALLVALTRSGARLPGRKLEIEPPSFLRSLDVELRQALLPLGPVLPLLALWDAVFLAEPTSTLGALRDVVAALPAVQAFVSLGLLFGALLLMPFLLRALWGARPLPAGELRDRLTAYAARVGLRTRDILVWPTGGAHHNAAVIGALPRFRYVFVTDALLEDLGADEVEAVFAHEAGHARRGHILLFFGFTAVLVLANLLPHALGAWLATPLAALDPLVRTVVSVLVWIGIVLGWISRRFEQEADVFGIETVAAPPGSPPGEHPFARALERIAEEAGGIREITGWRHFSIADRVEFVRRYVSEPEVRARYRRSIGLVRGTLLLVIAAVGAVAAARLPGELRAASQVWGMARDPAAQLLEPLQRAQMPAAPADRARELVSAATLAERAGRRDEALRWLREAAALLPADPAVLAVYARALEHAGRTAGARLAWEDALALPDAPEPLREAAREALRRLPATPR